MNNKTKNILIIIILCIILSLVIVFTSINNWYLIPVIIIGLIVLLFIIFRRKNVDINTGSPFLEEPVKDIKKSKKITQLEKEAKTLYINMLKYFMNLEYDKLHEILSDKLYKQFEKEMKTLESNNRRAIRENIEVIDITRHLDFDTGNAVKYLLRAGHKEDAALTPLEKQIEDFKKAAWYIGDKIKMLEDELRSEQQNNRDSHVGMHYLQAVIQKHDETMV